MGPLAQALLDWYGSNARDLPWRRAGEPYPVLVSEVMLQQTRVATVVPRWERWMERFPTVEALARADEDEVLEEWAGLGYYARARSLARLARAVADEGWPADAEGWRALPGVGPYTAGAMASSQGHDEPAVDGNVARVYARVCLDQDPAPLTRAAEWSRGHMPSGRAWEWNQALMELGATVCTPRSPRCGRCPIAKFCEGRRSKSAEELPAKRQRPAQVRLRLWIAAVRCEGLVGVRHVPPGPWWQGMRELPTFRTRKALLECLPGARLRRLGTFGAAVTRHRLSATVVLADPRALPVLEWREPSDLRGLSAPSQRALRLLAADGLDNPER